MKTKFNSLLFLLLMLPALIFAQSQVSGIVTENSSSLPLPGVNVVIKGTTTGTATDFDGKYQLSASAGDILVFSYVGYIPKEITYNGEASLNISLFEDAAQLDEVVLIGYGSVKKEDLTGAVDLVTTKDFNKGPVVSAQQLITGKIAGVSITSSGGAPGEGQEIRIRGNSSISLNNNPLIVLDGIPLDQGGVGGSRNPLNLVNPNDIESMTVLKDASATSIYGSRAANGVILVTTKRGKDSEFKFNTSLTSTVFNATDRVDVLSSSQFRDIITNHPQADANTIALLGDSNTNWQDEIYRTASGHDFAFSALGSAWGMPLRASIGFTNQDGVLRRDNFKRSTASLNVSPAFFDDHLKVDLNLRGNYTENEFGNRGAIAASIDFDPTQAIYDSNSPFGGYFTWLDPITGQQAAMSPTNPLALIHLRDDDSEVRRFVGNAKLDYKLHFFEDITATVSIGLDKSDSNGRTVTSADMPSTDPAYNGARQTYSNQATNQLFDAYLTYNKSFQEDKHNLTIVAGYSYQSFEYDNFDDDSEKKEQGTAYEFVDKSKSVLLSYFGRANYDINGKYLLTATLRADASSKLNPDDRWGYFPSVALAWNIHKEDFINDEGALNELKLRVGYGEVGNTNGLGDYLFLTRYSGSQASADYQFGNSFYQTYRPDPVNTELRWEVGKTINLGLDYAFFNRRLFGSVNLYSKKTDDLIAFASIDPFTNFGSRIDKNIGDMENKGIEFAVNVIPVRTETLEWSINFNVAFNDNKITRLPFDQETGGISGGVGNNIQIHREGYAPFSYNVYQQVYDTSGKPIEGAFVDRNGDNKITDADKYLYKDPYADVLMGINSSLSYKNWDFSIQNRASIGNYVYNNVASSKSYLSNMIPSNNLSLINIHGSYLNNGFTQQTDTNFLNSHFVEDGSFFKIDNITLGYTWNKAFNETDLRLFGSVQNVATFTNYDGLDPEINGGIDNNFYPRPRSFLLGINVDF